MTNISPEEAVKSLLQYGVSSDEIFEKLFGSNSPEKIHTEISSRQLDFLKKATIDKVQAGDYFGAAEIANQYGYSLINLGYTLPSDFIKNIPRKVLETILSEKGLSQKVKEIQQANKFLVNSLKETLSLDDLNFKEYTADFKFAYGRCLDQSLKSNNYGEFGKCTLFIDPKNNSWVFEILPHPDYLSKVKTPKELLEVAFKIGDNLGYHADLVPPNCFGVGGAYFGFTQEGFFTDGSSGSFGDIPTEFISNFFKGKIKHSSYIKKKFDFPSTRSILGGIGGQQSYTLFECFKTNDSKPSSDTNREEIDDDIPF